MFRLLQGLFSSMSLERKCLLYFGSALLLLMFIAFWFVQVIAQNLVKQTAQQAALDYANTIVARRHWEGINASDLSEKDREENSRILHELDRHLLNPGYEAEILMLRDETEYRNMSAATLPTDDAERRLLERLEPRFRQRMTELIAEQRPDLSKQLDVEENESFAQISPFMQPLFAESGPSGDRYTLYAPIFSRPICLLTCHSQVGGIHLSGEEDPALQAAQIPYRVVRVTMPSAATQATTTWIRAVVIAMAMLIIAVTLVVLHSIVRHLVLHPLSHLREVSDAITRGNTQLRAEIDTEDEFKELAEAFNRMLRHLTETQDQLREVNRELDQRVDQLAQLNLQLYEANRLKSDFLANMSHELRTPLNSIIGFSDVLQGIDSLDDKQRRYASNIQKSGRILLEMINDILDLAKVEAGKMEVRPVRFPLQGVISAQCDMVRSLSDDKNIDLICDVPDHLPPAVQDQAKVGQILTNLLSNAIKFTPEGGVVRVGAEDLQDGRFRISVADTGIGIAAEDNAAIFEKFRQSRSVVTGDGLTREFSGTGLGLSIVKELTKLLGGEVTFISQLGKGSTFYVTLPWHLEERPAARVPALPSASGLMEDSAALMGESLGTEILRREST